MQFLSKQNVSLASYKPLQDFEKTFMNQFQEYDIWNFSVIQINTKCSDKPGMIHL